MWSYFVKRVLSIIPTLFGITLICFVLINLMPGGPIETRIAEMQMLGVGQYSQQATDELVALWKKQYGFDKPLYARYFYWLGSIFTLDFGESYIYEEPVWDVIISKFPVSLQFGLVALILTYLISVPLGVFKGIKDGSVFDSVSTVWVLICCCVPSLIMGILLKTYFTGGGFLDWFPVGDLYSDQYFDKDWFGRVADRIHHFVLPTICFVITDFAILTMLVKNSLMNELKMDYVTSARARGLSEEVVIFQHAFRNSLIPIVTNLLAFVGVFFAGSIIIETMFTLDGIGLLIYNSILKRDYPVVMAIIFLQAVLFLISRIGVDFLYMYIDPRVELK